MDQNIKKLKFENIGFEEFKKVVNQSEMESERDHQKYENF
jgi:hypothetical protein